MQGVKLRTSFKSRSPASGKALAHGLLLSKDLSYIDQNRRSSTFSSPRQRPDTVTQFGVMLAFPRSQLPPRTKPINQHVCRAAVFVPHPRHTFPLSSARACLRAHTRCVCVCACRQSRVCQPAEALKFPGVSLLPLPRPIIPSAGRVLAPQLLLSRSLPPVVRAGEAEEFGATILRSVKPPFAL